MLKKQNIVAFMQEIEISEKSPFFREEAFIVITKNSNILTVNTSQDILLSFTPTVVISILAVGFDLCMSVVSPPIHINILSKYFSIFGFS